MFLGIRKFILFLIEFLLMYLSLFIIYYVRHGIDEINTFFYLYFFHFGILYIFWFLVLYSFKFYDFHVKWYFSSYAYPMVTNLIIAIIYFYITKGFFTDISPRIDLFLNTILFPLIDFPIRTLYKKLFVNKFFTKNIVIINLQKKNLNLIYEHFLKETPGYKIKAIYSKEVNSDDFKKYDNNLIVFSDLALIDNIIKEYKISWLIIDSFNDSDSILKFYNILAKFNVKAYDIVSFIERTEYRIPLDYISNFWVITHLFFLDNKIVDLKKRFFDISLSLLFSPILVFLFILVSLLIKLTSKGPIFYKQERMGKGGRSFFVYKFRSMYYNSDKDSTMNKYFIKQNDNRITLIGRLIRPLGIDELPQIINILKGEMSLIGPRPYAKDLSDLYLNEIPNYALKYIVSPGLSGWAQVNHNRSVDLENVKVRTEYDLFYVKNRGILLDIKIVLKTIKILLLFKDRT